MYWSLKLWDNSRDSTHLTPNDHKIDKNWSNVRKLIEFWKIPLYTQNRSDFITEKKWELSLVNLTKKMWKYYIQALHYIHKKGRYLKKHFKSIDSRDSSHNSRMLRKMRSL